MRDRILATAILGITLLVAAAKAAETDIDQRGIRFSRADIAVKVGDTLHFHNHDDVTHNIMVIDADDEPEDEGLQKPGEIINATFDEAGTFQVRCAIHPKMKMTVTVNP